MLRNVFLNHRPSVQKKIHVIVHCSIIASPKCWYSSEMQVFILYPFSKNSAIGASLDISKMNTTTRHSTYQRHSSVLLIWNTFWDVNFAVFTVYRFLQQHLLNHSPVEAAGRSGWSGDQMERGVGWTRGLRRLQPAGNYSQKVLECCSLYTPSPCFKMTP